jgi:ribonuclease HI
MNSKEKKDQALDSFWGPVLAETIHTHIYIEGAYFENKSAGSGIYFGPASPMNTCLLLPTSERPTADLARLVAIQEAVTMVPPDRSLLIFCTSKYVIRQLCYSTAKNNSLGWPGKNGEAFKSVAKLLASRHGTTCFVYVESTVNNASKTAAHLLAKSTLTNPPHRPENAQQIITCNRDHSASESRTGRKVFTPLEEISPPKPKAWKSGEDSMRNQTSPTAVAPRCMRCSTPSGSAYWDARL